MGGYSNLTDKDRTNGFNKRPDDINRTGRQPSIRNQIRELLSKNGTLTIPNSSERKSMRMGQ